MTRQLSDWIRSAPLTWPLGVRPRRGSADVSPTLFVVAVLAAALALLSCGKKGNPLPPLIKTPVRPDDFQARRVGEVVYAQFVVPSRNGDNTSPADIVRVEVYGFTGSPGNNDDVIRRGMLVASVNVRKPADEEAGPSAPAGSGGTTGRPPGAAASVPGAADPDGVDQGAIVVVTEPIGPAQRSPVQQKTRPRPTKAPVLDFSPPLLGPPPFEPPARLYVAVGVNHKGRRGAVSARSWVPLVDVSSAPGVPRATYTETAITVAWTPPSDARLPIQRLPEEGELPPLDRGLASMATTYNVYEVPPPVAGGAATQGPRPVAVGGALPTPLNAKPLPVLSFLDGRMDFGTTRCYTVRAVTRVGTLLLESEASPPTCVPLQDTFPPLAPGVLRGVAGPGEVSLIWEPSPTGDVVGYLVLRGEAGREPVPITAEPVKDTAFRDSTARRGVRYGYVVVAVDGAGNRSPASNRVEETARDPEASR